MTKFNAIKISDSVYWVGAIDWNVRNFHGYNTARGTTYNAFLIIDKKITLIDVVKKGFFEEMKLRISSIVNPEKIDYIISNHSEPDHTGTISEAIKEFIPEKIFASKMGVKAINAHYDLDFDINAVKDGERISIGKKNISFMETRMLHWPDSMFSYLEEEKVLFSQDAFGMHLASSERFGGELSWDILKRQAESYYANIITLYSPHVVRLLKKVEESGMKIEVIAPDHGPVWRGDEKFKRLIELYKKWSNRNVDKKVVIIYDTMWKATETMARHIEDGVKSEGVKVEVMCLSNTPRSDVADEMLNAAGIVVGSSTLNNNLLPSVADNLTYIKGLKFKTPFAGVFGSYGWSGEAVKQITSEIEKMESEIVGTVKVQYTPKEKTKKLCFELGKKIAKKIKKMEEKK